MRTRSGVAAAVLLIAAQPGWCGSLKDGFKDLLNNAANSQAAQTQGQQTQPQALATSQTSQPDLATSGLTAQAMQEGFVRKYVEASVQITTAQILLAQAFELSDQAALLTAQVDALKSGAVLDKATIDKQRKLTNDASVAIQQKIDSGTQLTAEGRTYYAQSLIPFFAGAYNTTKLPAEGKIFADAAQKQMQSASVLDKVGAAGKYVTGLYLVTQVPGYAGKILDSGGKLATYANNNQIPVPPDAMKILE